MERDYTGMELSKAMSSQTKKTMTFSNLVQTVPNY